MELERDFTFSFSKFPSLIFAFIVMNNKFFFCYKEKKRKKAKKNNELLEGEKNTRRRG